MTTKGIALKAIARLPEDVSWEDIRERINFIVGMPKGLRELEEGQGIPHGKIKEESSKVYRDSRDILCGLRRPRDHGKA